MKHATRFLGGLTVAAAVVVALVGGLSIVQAIEDLWGVPTAYSAPNVWLRGQALDLVGARDEALTFYLSQTSPNGLWAAPDGLRLELGNEQTGFSTSAQVVTPRQKAWVDPIFAVNMPFHHPFEDVHIQGSFTVPDVPGPETQTLAGRLRGELLYPGTTEDGEHFTTDVRNLDIPASLEIVSPVESGRISSSFRRVRYGRIGLGLLYFVLAMGYAMTYGMWRDRQKTRRWEPYLPLVAGVAVWACFGVLWLKPFGA